MPIANVAARAITKIEIGIPNLRSSRDFNGDPIDVVQNFVSLEVGFDSYQQGTGLVLIRGTLVLSELSPDGLSLSPFDNIYFAVGNQVVVYMDGVLHPLASPLFILSTPSLSPTNPSVPLTKGNRTLTLDLGCRLSRYKIAEMPDSDQTGVVLGELLDIRDACKNLLVASGMPAYDTDVCVLPLSDVKFSFPYSKNGGSFVDLAGEVWYSNFISLALGSFPTFMYCDQGVVRSGSVRENDDLVTDFSVTLGLHDREYQWQPDTSTTPGKVTMTGVKRTLVDTTLDYPFTDTVASSDGSSSETTYHRYELGEGKPLDIVFPHYDIFNLAPYSLEMPVPPANTLAYEGQTIIQMQTNQENFNQVSTKETGKEYSYSFYSKNNGLLSYQITSRYVPASTLYPSGWEDDETPLPGYPDVLINTVATTYKDTLVPSEVTIVQYFYEGSTVKTIKTVTLSNYFLLDKNSVFADNFLWAFNKAPIPTQGGFNGEGEEEDTSSFNMSVKVLKEESWKLVLTKWAYTVKDFSASIINNPTRFDDPFEVKLELQPKPIVPFTSISTSAQNVPPSPRFWDGRYSVKETSVTDSVILGTGLNTKEVRLTMPFAFASNFDDPIDSSPQPLLFAKIEGQLLAGRQYQCLIECSSFLPGNFEPSKISRPLPTVDVIEFDLSDCPNLAWRSVVRYRADALTWFHTRDSCYIAFAGIYAGGLERQTAGGVCELFNLAENPVSANSFVQPLVNGTVSISVTSISNLANGYRVTYSSGDFSGNYTIVSVDSPTQITVSRQVGGSPAGTDMPLGGTISVIVEENVTPTDDSFVQPLVGGSVSIPVSDTTILNVGDRITYSSGDLSGNYTIVSVDSPTQVTVFRQLDGSPDGTVMPQGGTIAVVEEMDRTTQDAIVSEVLIGTSTVDGFILQDQIIGGIDKNV